MRHNSYPGGYQRQSTGNLARSRQPRPNPKVTSWRRLRLQHCQNLRATTQPQFGLTAAQLPTLPAIWQPRAQLPMHPTLDQPRNTLARARTTGAIHQRRHTTQQFPTQHANETSAMRRLDAATTLAKLSQQCSHRRLRASSCEKTTVLCFAARDQGSEMTTTK